MDVGNIRPNPIHNDGNDKNQSTLATQTYISDYSKSTLSKRDHHGTRPCAIIEPDRIIPPQQPRQDVYTNVNQETWHYGNSASGYHRTAGIHHQIAEVYPTRNISPRQTFQENMPRILVPPRVNSGKCLSEPYTSANYPHEGSVYLPKPVKYNMPPIPKYADNLYSANVYPVEHNAAQKVSEHTTNYATKYDQSNLITHVGPQNSRNWGQAPADVGVVQQTEVPKYMEYQHYAPHIYRPVRPARKNPEEIPTNYVSDVLYRSDLRYDPYPVPKDKFTRGRYDYPYNPNQYHPPYNESLKYNNPKAMLAQHIPIPYHQNPYKYLDNQCLDPNSEYLQKLSASRHSISRDFVPNVPYQQNDVSPKYPPAELRFIQSRMYGYNGDFTPYPSNVKVTHENKMFTDYNDKLKSGPLSEAQYHMNIPVSSVYKDQSQNISNYPFINASHRTHPFHMQYRNYDHSRIKLAAEYNLQNKHQDINQTCYNPLARIPAQFSPNIISPTDSSASIESSSQANNQDDCGYVSQCSTTSARSVEYSNKNCSYENCYDKLSPIRYNIPNCNFSFPSNKSNSREYVTGNRNNSVKSKKQLDVRQFLQMWNEDFESGPSNLTSGDVTEAIANKQLNTKDSILNRSNNEDQLYVLSTMNISKEELNKYEHIQKVTKLPDNIKGYDNVELLNQFDQVFGVCSERKSPPSANKFTVLETVNKSTFITLDTSGIRPISPLDVESKISQSIIHKEVGCNFEIKPCSPDKTNSNESINTNFTKAVTYETANKNEILHHNKLGVKPRDLAWKDSIHDKQSTASNEIKLKNSSIICGSGIKPLIGNCNDFANKACLASLPQLDCDLDSPNPNCNKTIIEPMMTESNPASHLKISISGNKTDFNLRNEMNPSENLAPHINNKDGGKNFSKLSKFRRTKVKDLTSDNNYAKIQPICQSLNDNMTSNTNFSLENGLKINNSTIAMNDNHIFDEYDELPKDYSTSRRSSSNEFDINNVILEEINMESKEKQNPQGKEIKNSNVINTSQKNNTSIEILNNADNASDSTTEISHTNANPIEINCSTSNYKENHQAVLMNHGISSSYAGKTKPNPLYKEHLNDNTATVIRTADCYGNNTFFPDVSFKYCRDFDSEFDSSMQLVKDAINTKQQPTEEEKGTCNEEPNAMLDKISATSYEVSLDAENKMGFDYSHNLFSREKNDNLPVTPIICDPIHETGHTQYHTNEIETGKAVKDNSSLGMVLSDIKDPIHNIVEKEIEEITEDKWILNDNENNHLSLNYAVDKSKIYNSNETITNNFCEHNYLQQFNLPVMLTNFKVSSENLNFRNQSLLKRQINHKLTQNTDTNTVKLLIPFKSNKLKFYYKNIHNFINSTLPKKTLRSKNIFIKFSLDKLNLLSKKTEVKFADLINKPSVSITPSINCENRERFAYSSESFILSCPSEEAQKLSNLSTLLFATYNLVKAIDQSSLQHFDINSLMNRTELNSNTSFFAKKKIETRYWETEILNYLTNSMSDLKLRGGKKVNLKFFKLHHLMNLLKNEFINVNRNVQKIILPEKKQLLYRSNKSPYKLNNKEVAQELNLHSTLQKLIEINERKKILTVLANFFHKFLKFDNVEYCGSRQNNTQLIEKHMADNQQLVPLCTILSSPSLSKNPKNNLQYHQYNNISDVYCKGNLIFLNTDVVFGRKNIQTFTKLQIEKHDMLVSLTNSPYTIKENCVNLFKSYYSNLKSKSAFFTHSSQTPFFLSSKHSGLHIHTKNVIKRKRKIESVKPLHITNCRQFSKNLVVVPHKRLKLSITTTNPAILAHTQIHLSDVKSIIDHISRNIDLKPYFSEIYRNILCYKHFFNSLTKKTVRNVISDASEKTIAKKNIHKKKRLKVSNEAPITFHIENSNTNLASTSFSQMEIDKTENLLRSNRLLVSDIYPSLKDCTTTSSYMEESTLMISNSEYTDIPEYTYKIDVGENRKSQYSYSTETLGKAYFKNEVESMFNKENGNYSLLEEQLINAGIDMCPKIIVEKPTNVVVRYENDNSIETGIIVEQVRLPLDLFSNMKEKSVSEISEVIEEILSRRNNQENDKTDSHPLTNSQSSEYTGNLNSKYIYIKDHINHEICNFDSLEETVNTPCIEPTLNNEPIEGNTIVKNQNVNCEPIDDWIDDVACVETVVSEDNIDSSHSIHHNLSVISHNNSMHLNCIDSAENCGNECVYFTAFEDNVIVSESEIEGIGDVKCNFPEIMENHENYSPKAHEHFQISDIKEFIENTDPHLKITPEYFLQNEEVYYSEESCQNEITETGDDFNTTNFRNINENNSGISKKTTSFDEFNMGYEVNGNNQNKKEKCYKIEKAQIEKNINCEYENITCDPDTSEEGVSSTVKGVEEYYTSDSNSSELINSKCQDREVEYNDLKFTFRITDNEKYTYDKSNFSSQQKNRCKLFNNTNTDVCTENIDMHSEKFIKLGHDERAPRSQQKRYDDLKRKIPTNIHKCSSDREPIKTCYQEEKLYYGNICASSYFNSQLGESSWNGEKRLITKAAQKYIPPLSLSAHNFKVHLPLPKSSLERLKEMKGKNDLPNLKLKIKLAPDKSQHTIEQYSSCPKFNLPKKQKPNFDDVLKNIDSNMKNVLKRSKHKVEPNSIPKMIIKKNELGSHYATHKRNTYTPDLTGSKWQPWVSLQRSGFIDRMIRKHQRQALFCSIRNKYTGVNTKPSFGPVKTKFKALLKDLEPIKCTIKLNGAKMVMNSHKSFGPTSQSNNCSKS